MDFLPHLWHTGSPRSGGSFLTAVFPCPHGECPVGYLPVQVSVLFLQVLWKICSHTRKGDNNCQTENALLGHQGCAHSPAQAGPVVVTQLRMTLSELCVSLEVSLLRCPVVHLSYSKLKRHDAKSIEVRGKTSTGQALLLTHTYNI